MSPKTPANGPATKRHPIQVVVRRTGLSADVLRAWEKRYDVLQPKRSDGGRRLYSDQDIEHLRLLRRATDGGRSIGQVAALAPQDLAELVREDEAAVPARAVEPGQEGPVVDGALADMAALDARRLYERLGRAMVDLPSGRFLEGVITPFLHAIGVGWEAGTLRPAHEHLASGVLLRVLHEFLAAVTPAAAGPVLVAGTPQGVRHEFGAFLAAATAGMAGWDVTYVGADLPADELIAAARGTGARALALSLVPPLDAEDVAAELRAVRAALPDDVTIVIGGAAARDVGRALEGIRVQRCHDLASLRAVLEVAAGGQPA